MPPPFPHSHTTTISPDPPTSAFAVPLPAYSNSSAVALSVLANDALTFFGIVPQLRAVNGSSGVATAWQSLSSPPSPSAAVTTQWTSLSDGAVAFQVRALSSGTPSGQRSEGAPVRLFGWRILPCLA